MITISVVGMLSTATTADTIAQAKTKALALARIYPSMWVHALDEDGQVVHRIEPRALVTDDGEPDDEDRTPLPDQEAMF